MESLTDKQIKVLEKGLALHKEIRTQSVTQLLSELKSCIGEVTEKKHRKIRAKVIGMIAGVAVVAAAAVGVFYSSPWRPTVEKFGCSNTNLSQESDYQLIPGQYEYLMDAEWNLYVVPYNEEDQTFYIDSGTIVDDEAGSINIGNTKAYFIHDQSTEDGDHDSIVQMDLDGSNIQTVIQQDGLLLMQYVQLSNDKEYLYYTTKPDENFSCKLYRYDLGSGKNELVNDDMYWFNIYGKYLYYVNYDGNNPDSYCTLHRSFLDGSGDKILDDEHCLYNGYVVDGNIYMSSLSQEIIVQVDENKKNSVKTIGGDYSNDIASGVSVYGDGWIYYCAKGTTEIDRVMVDGTGKEAVSAAGQNVLRLNYVNDWLLIVEGEYDSEGEIELSSSSLVSKDGSKSMSLGNPNFDGLTYTIVDGQAYLTGYTGSRSHVSVPQTIDGYPYNSSTAYFSDLGDVTLHLEISADEKTYEKVDGGICITGYNPGATKDNDYLAIPSEIEGQPVVEIGESAFSNKDKEEDDQYDFVQMLLPDTIQSIDAHAFNLCESLEYINIPSGLKKLGESSFAHCPLTDLEIVFPDGMQSIGMMAFVHAKLKSVYLPDTLEIIGVNPFVGCGRDSEDAGELFLIDNNSTSFCVEDGVLYNADKTVLYAVQGYRTGTLTIPDTVTDIRGEAFTKARYTSVTVPASVNDYDFAFVSSYIETVTIENGVTEIPEGAFYYSGELTKISIPDTVKSISNNAFKECGRLSSVTISSDCTVDDEAFDSTTKIVRG